MADKSTSVKVTLKVSSFILRMLMNVVFYILVVVAVIFVSKQAYNFTYQLYGPVTVDEAPGRDIPIQIKKGDSTMDIATKLELNRAIVNKYSFFVKTKLQNLSIMAGSYHINSSMTYDQILDIITDYKNSYIQDEEQEAKKDEEDATKDASDGDTAAADEAASDTAADEEATDTTADEDAADTTTEKNADGEAEEAAQDAE